MNRTEKPNGGPLMAANMTRAELAAEAKRASLIYCRALLDCSDRATEKNVQVAEHAAKSLQEAIDQLAAHQAEWWQPIETAPKDMAARLFLVNGVCAQGFVDATGSLCVMPENRSWRKMVGKPTHWQPLLKPPALPSNGGAGEAL